MVLPGIIFSFFPTVYFTCFFFPFFLQSRFQQIAVSLELKQQTCLLRHDKYLVYKTEGKAEN
jgi:hypothetical protein